MTLRRYVPILACAALALLAATPADAQRRDAAARPAPSAAPAGSATANRNVTTLVLNLPRTEVERAMPGEGTAPKRSLRDRIGQSLKKTATGDKGRVEAAEKVLAAKAQQAAPDARSTMVVVIGTTEDMEKVVASLALAKRKVVVAHVDKDLEDDNTWNTALSSGVVGDLGGDKASNVWVFLPRRGATPRAKPDHVLSSKVVGPSVWNGIFAADGDELDVDQLAGSLSRDSSASRPADGAPVPAGGAAFADGDVVLPKIAGVKVYADASPTSRVVGSAGKTDEFVVDGAPKNGMVKVAGSALSGWIAVNMLKKQ